jgi:hypothetical protein
MLAKYKEEAMTTKFTNEEIIERRLEVVQDSIANQRLEGLEVDSRTVEDLEHHARGEITIEEVLKRIHTRIENGEF